MSNEALTNELVMEYTIEATLAQSGPARAPYREASIEFDKPIQGERVRKKAGCCSMMRGDCDANDQCCEVNVMSAKYTQDRE